MESVCSHICKWPAFDASSHKTIFFTTCLTLPVVLVLSKSAAHKNLVFQQDLSTEAVHSFCLLPPTQALMGVVCE